MEKITLSMILLISILTSCNSVDNSINVTVDDNLDLDLVKVEYGFYSGNEESDKKLVDNGLDKTIFENGNPKSFNTICGENDFLVTYADKYYVKVRHFIPNDFDDGIPDGHKYNFEIIDNQNTPLLKLEIEGTDGEIITKEFAEIKNAANNKQGR
ncbi:hypothetical protein OO013_07925 [Mangrovivirga sp. M17]|uniref:Lipoprotein n=1 Tax=Mangrovivirga halotolerans TaxID=2993936 RepID=A0ABT3RQZ8_9BACT|nr:hypothetical protein [Mangrovivirga halotolerans]MCX2743788.1 hypothetical protein [Mangrovivirga halotolerans]